MFTLLLLLACSPDVAPGPSAAGRLVAGTLAWTTPLLPPPPADVPPLERQRQLLALEARADAVVAVHARARGEAAVSVYTTLATRAGEAPSPELASAVDTLVAADRAVWLAAVDVACSALEATPTPELAARVGGGAAIPLGAVDRLVRDQARLSIPPIQDLPSLDRAERDAVFASERARTESLASAVAGWRSAVAAWTPGGPTAPLRDAATPLADAFEASLRARHSLARQLLDAMDDADRARTFVSPGLRAYVGAAPVGEVWGFAFHRDGPAPPDDGGDPSPQDAPVPQNAPEPQGAAPPGTRPPAEFPAGTGDPGAFPTGTGAPDVLPPGAPAPDGAAPPPEVHQNGPPPPPPPPPGVEPPPGVAGPPKDGGFNGMRPQK